MYYQLQYKAVIVLNNVKNITLINFKTYFLL